MWFMSDSRTADPQKWPFAATVTADIVKTGGWCGLSRECAHERRARGDPPAPALEGVGPAGSRRGRPGRRRAGGLDFPAQGWLVEHRADRGRGGRPDSFRVVERLAVAGLAHHALR